MSWANEMVQQQKLQFLWVLFVLADHANFSPDVLFSKVAQSYNRSDVFNTDELKDIISLNAEVIVDSGTIWGETGAFSNILKAIWNLKTSWLHLCHTPCYFRVVTRVCELCYTGPFRRRKSLRFFGGLPSTDRIIWGTFWSTWLWPHLLLQPTPATTKVTTNGVSAAMKWWQATHPKARLPGKSTTSEAISWKKKIWFISRSAAFNISERRRTPYTWGWTDTTWT